MYSGNAPLSQSLSNAVCLSLSLLAAFVVSIPTSTKTTPSKLDAAVSASQTSTTDSSPQPTTNLTGRPVNFDSIVRDGFSHIAQRVNSFELWDISAVSDLEGGSQIIEDFENQVSIRVRSTSTMAIFESHNFVPGLADTTDNTTTAGFIIDDLTVNDTDTTAAAQNNTTLDLEETYWSPVSSQGQLPPGSKPQHPWKWTDIQIPLEQAIHTSQQGPHDHENWSKIVLSISINEKQLPSPPTEEPLWKFYRATKASRRDWYVGVGAVTGRMVYNTPTPPVLETVT